VIAVLIICKHNPIFRPLLKDNQPISFLPISREKNLIHLAYSWLNSYFSRDKIYLLCEYGEEEQIKSMLPSVKEDKILIEPIRLSYSLSVSYASILLSRLEPEETVTIIPADFLFSPEFRCENWLFASNEFAGYDNIILPSINLSTANYNRPIIDSGKFKSNIRNIDFFEINKISAVTQAKKSIKLFGKEGVFSGIIISSYNAIFNAIRISKLNEVSDKIQTAIFENRFNWDLLTNIYKKSGIIDDNTLFTSSNKKFFTIFLDTNPFYLDNWKNFFARFSTDITNRNLIEGSVSINNCRETACFNYDEENIVISDTDKLLIVKENGKVIIKSLIL